MRQVIRSDRYGLGRCDRYGTPIVGGGYNHVGEEVIRSAICPQHPAYRSSQFEGMIGGAWLFYCRDTEGGHHRFLATP